MAYWTKKDFFWYKVEQTFGKILQYLGKSPERAFHRRLQMKQALGLGFYIVFQERMVQGASTAWIYSMTHPLQSIE